jgi:anaerobic ribonucleoside-triphosphate reductase
VTIPEWLEERVEIADCDKCVPCNVYSRIVGYITPVGQWNRGKQQEFADRQVYRVANNGERQC